MFQKRKAEASLQKAREYWNRAHAEVAPHPDFGPTYKGSFINLLEAYAHAHAAAAAAPEGSSTYKAADAIMWNVVEAVQKAAGQRRGNPQKRSKKNPKPKASMRSIMSKALK